MISIVCGKTGSGKTKKMLELANEAVKSAKGEIVFVDVKEKFIYDLHRNIRFINVNEFSIKGHDEFFGFVNGLIAENYDIDEIYVDNLLNITNTNVYDLELFLNNLKRIGEKFQVRFIFSTNCDEGELPTFINEYVVALI